MADDVLKYHEDLAPVAAEDVRFIKVKDTQYNASWKQRGGAGSFFMLARKWDRLENALKGPKYSYDIFAAMEDQQHLGGDDGSVLAEVRDLRRYLLNVEAEMISRGIVPRPGTVVEKLIGSETAPKKIDVIQSWRCPQTGERVWDDLYKRYGTVSEVLQDGDAGIRFDNGKPPYQSKWHRMWVLLDQTPPHPRPNGGGIGQDHPFGYQADDD